MSEYGAATHLDLSTISVGTLGWNWWLMWLTWKLFNFNTCPAVGVGLPQLCCLFTLILLSDYQPSQFITIYLLDSFQSTSLVVAPKPARHNYASLFHQLVTFQTMPHEFVVKVIMWHKFAFAVKLLFISLYVNIWKRKLHEGYYPNTRFLAAKSLHWNIVYVDPLLFFFSWINHLLVSLCNDKPQLTPQTCLSGAMMESN